MVCGKLLGFNMKLSDIIEESLEETMRELAGESMQRTKASFSVKEIDNGYMFYSFDGSKREERFFRTFNEITNFIINLKQHFIH